jgi:hypothetical protein
MRGGKGLNEDLQHLRLLSIFHYVVAGIAGLFALFPVIHLVLGVALMTGALEGEADEPVARFAGLFFVVLATTMILLGLTFAVLLAVAGRFLVRHQRYTFCLVMAGVACMFMPFGTVLGVFTIVVLTKDSVKQLFGKRLPNGGTKSD